MSELFAEITTIDGEDFVPLADYHEMNQERLGLRRQVEDLTAVLGRLMLATNPNDPQWDSTRLEAVVTAYAQARALMSESETNPVT